MKETDLQNTKEPQGSPRLQIVAWEVTRACNLNCVHCRASSDSGPYPEEMDTEEALSIIDQITEVGRPIVILTGGEPLLRKDIFTLAAYGAEKGLRMVMGSNGTLVTRNMARQISESGIKRVSISLDGATSKSHDQFRQVSGAFLRAMEGIARLKEQGVEFQVNTTITRQNLFEAKEILDLSVRLGAVAHHVFLLVPTGRAKEMAGQELTAKEYEDTLHWFYQQQSVVPLQFKATCAPQFYRISQQEARAKGEELERKRETHGLDAVTRGCLAGISYCFVSHVGVVQPCGYLDLSAGDLRESALRHIWDDSPIFEKLRDFSGYKGKCGRCKYIAVCGGCRARAYAATGDYLEQEPLCAYNPSG
jgi:heme b synthase